MGDWWILLNLKMPVSSSPPALLTPSSLDPETQELFLIRVPSHLPTSILQNAVIDLKHPSALQHEGRQYLPIVGKGGVKAAVLPGSQGLVESLEVKAVVTLQEDVQVPSMPEIQVPERYRVPKLEGLAVGRHPIYGTSLKSIDVKPESDKSLEPAKKKKKRRKSGSDDNLGEALSSVKEEPESVEEHKKKKKRKKDKLE